MMKVWKQVFVAGLLMGAAGAALAGVTYKPDDLVRFNHYNQCASCDLSGAKLTGNHSNASLIYSNLTGSKGAGTFSSAVFYGSNLSSADWRGVNLSYANLTYIPLVKTNFSHADLSYANFEGALTNDAVFDDANLYGANISQSQLDRASSYCGATLPNGTKKNC